MCAKSTKIKNLPSIFKFDNNFAFMSTKSQMIQKYLTMVKNTFCWYQRYNITLGHKYWLVHYKFGGCWSEITVWRCKIIIKRVLSQGDKFWWIMVDRSQLIYFNCFCLSFSLHTIFVQWKIHSNCIKKISLATRKVMIQKKFTKLNDKIR